MARPAKLSDVQAVARIHVETWKEAYQGIIPDAYLQTLSIAEREEKWKQLIIKEQTELWVAEKDSLITGWVSFGSSRDCDSRSETGEIFAIYILPSFWSIGVGKELMIQAMTRLEERGFTLVTLWVLVENKRAIKFYEKVGFTPEANTVKSVEIGGKALQEVRYVKSVNTSYSK